MPLYFDNTGNKTGSDDKAPSENRFIILYPNGGTKDKPAEVTTNVRLVFENPFKGKQINCRAEVYVNNLWGASPWHAFLDSTNMPVARGAVAYPLFSEALAIDEVILQTGSYGVAGYSKNTGSPQNLNANYTKAPCRILVWRID